MSNTNLKFSFLHLNERRNIFFKYFESDVDWHLVRKFGREKLPSHFIDKISQPIARQNRNRIFIVKLLLGKKVYNHKAGTGKVANPVQ
jgi:hypothetical protein